MTRVRMNLSNNISYCFNCCWLYQQSTPVSWIDLDDLDIVSKVCLLSQEEVEPFFGQCSFLQCPLMQEKMRNSITAVVWPKCFPYLMHILMPHHKSTLSSTMEVLLRRRENGPRWIITPNCVALAAHSMTLFCRYCSLVFDHTSTFRQRYLRGASLHTLLALHVHFIAFLPMCKRW